MIQKPFAAFGHVLIKNSYADKEIVIGVIKEDIQCTTFWVKGKFENENLETGERCIDFVPGTIYKPADYTTGVFKHTVVGDTEVFCYDIRRNNGRDIDLTAFHLPGASETILPVGTKLFLCSGLLSIGNLVVDRPMQIRIENENVLLTANEDCYGLIFP
jgi:hypothetical protein